MSIFRNPSLNRVDAPQAPVKQSRSRHPFRGVLAASATALMIGAAVVAPFSMPQASAQEEYEAFAERIHQQFVPEVVEQPEIELVAYELEVLPEPEPEPEPVVLQVYTPPAPPMYTGGGSPAEWMAAAGIPESDWGYVDYIVTRESGWNPNATNASSGACGLVQALPCSKVPGSGYNPVDNLTWANGYAQGRYGSWAAAYEFWTNNHWW